MLIFFLSFFHAHSYLMIPTISPTAQSTVTLDKAPHSADPIYSFLEFVTHVSPDSKEEEVLKQKHTARKTISPSYFHAHFGQLYSVPSHIPIRLNIDLSSSSHIHPTWKNWDSLWKKPPVIFDNISIQDPQAETEYEDVFFRIKFTHITARHIPQQPRFRQGTTVSFVGFDSSKTRHIVEWCLKKDEHHTYLKVVGIDEDQHLFPYNDISFPTFILVVPSYLTNVPYPPTYTAPHSPHTSPCIITRFLKHFCTPFGLW